MCLLCLFLSSLSFCSKEEKKDLFSYDLHISKISRGGSKAFICFHGMGGDYQIIDYVQKYAPEDQTLISFNFPDYGIRLGSFDPHKIYLGTVDELLPAIHVLKKTVIEDGFREVSLYGFSAGGGAIINTLMILNSSSYDNRLKEIGLTLKDKKKILTAIQKGKILLDAPLKSLGEMIDFHDPMNEIDIVAARYAKNSMEPIDNILKLKGLKLHFLVNFQLPDEILSNRDDLLYIERLKSINPNGSTASVIEGQGHGLPHPHLWDLYNKSF